MADAKAHQFVGTWMLDPATATYEQGDPPANAIETISMDDEELIIEMDWTAADGEIHHAAFRARLDGTPISFNGGQLADTLTMTAPSDRELVTTASLAGRELMRAVRILDAPASTMTLIQVVRLPDGTTPTNRADYRRDT